MGGRGSSSRMTSGSMPDSEKHTYHYFYDKAAGGFEYEGDGHHQEAWFKANSNVDEILNAVDSDTRDAMSDWTAGHFMLGQQYDGWDNMSQSDKARTQRYDDMLDKSVINKGVTVVRRTTAEWLFGAGKTTASISELQAAEGDIVTIKGNMSTGAARHGLTIGSGSKRHEIEIHIPGGSKGAGMWIGDRRVNPGWGAKQREFMTNRDINVQVGKTRYDSSRDVYITEVTFIGREKHDYGKTGRLKL